MANIPNFQHYYALSEIKVNESAFKSYSQTQPVKETLKSKTWIPNDTITLPTETVTYNITFQFYGSEQRSSQLITLSNTSIVYGADGDNTEFTAYTDGSYVNRFCDVISFTDGVDIQNEKLITWFKSNGNIVDTITTLVGHTRKMNLGDVMKSFGGADGGALLYELKGTVTCSKITENGIYLLFNGVNTYYPVEWSGGSVGLTGNHVWHTEKSNVWWYRTSDMHASDELEHVNLPMGEAPVISITGGSGATIFRVINWFQKNSTEVVSE